MYTHIYMYEKWNYLSFYNRIKKRQFWIPLKIPYKRTVHFFQFSFVFYLSEI